jgi:hypothetical protein
MAAQKPSFIGGTNRLAAIFVAVAFVFWPEAIGDDVINLVGNFPRPCIALAVLAGIVASTRF